MQNFKFKLSNSLDPVGSAFEEQRLWNASFIGYWKRVEIGFL